jgi:hypothetical protein
VPIVAQVDDLVVPESDPTELEARLHISGDHMDGEVRMPDGRWIAFDGWLGLIGAVEAALPADPVARDDAATATE